MYTRIQDLLIRGFKISQRHSKLQIRFQKSGDGFKISRIGGGNLSGFHPFRVIEDQI